MTEIDAKSFGEGYLAGYKAAIEIMTDAVITAMAKEKIEFKEMHEKPEVNADAE